MNVLHDQRELLLAAIVAASEAGLADRAADWITPERLVISTAVVVAREAEASREGQNQEGWRERNERRPPSGKLSKPRMSRIDARWIPDNRRIEGREQSLHARLINAADEIVASLKCSPRGIDDETAQTEQHKDGCYPPVISSLRLEKSANLGQWNW